MKTYLNQKPGTSKVRKVWLIPIFVFFSFCAIGQGTDADLMLTSCYQSIPLDGKIHTVIAGVDYKFTPVGTAASTYVNINTYDDIKNAISFDYSQLTLGEFISKNRWIDYSDGSVNYKTVELINYFGQFNNNSFTFHEETRYTSIRLITKDPNGNLYSSPPTPIHVISMDDALSLTNNSDESCFLFDEFNLGKVLEIDGFCGEIDATIRWAENEIIDDGALEKWDIQLNKQLDISEIQTHCDDNQVQCFTDHTVDTYPVPIPCGCKNFTVDLVIYGCHDKKHDPDCPPLTVSKDIQVCCECDIRKKQAYD